MATMMPVIESIDMAAIAMPYRPSSPGCWFRKYDTRMPAPMTSTGRAVLIMPIAWPAMMLVAAPVVEARAISRTGGKSALVKNSVIPTNAMVTTTPTTAAQNRLIFKPASSVTTRKPASASTALTPRPR